MHQDHQLLCDCGLFLQRDRYPFRDELHDGDKHTRRGQLFMQRFGYSLGVNMHLDYEHLGYRQLLLHWDGRSYRDGLHKDHEHPGYNHLFLQRDRQSFRINVHRHQQNLVLVVLLLPERVYPLWINLPNQRCVAVIGRKEGMDRPG